MPFRHPISKADIDGFAEQAEKKLRELSSIVLKGLTPPAGAYAFFHHSGHALARLGDCRKIISRLFQQRYLLVELAIERRKIEPKNWPAGTAYPKEIQELLKKDGEISGYMQLDIESLYIFGGILLDQWALQVIAIGNLPLKKKIQNINPFTDLLVFFEEGNKSIIDRIWEDNKDKLLWLYYQMRFYRNRFIIHANRPWQRGSACSVYGEDYSLHTPTPPGWTDDKKLDEQIRGMIQFAPDYIQKAPDKYWEKERPGALIERIFDNIGKVEKREDRRRIADLFGEKGGTTPTFQILAKNLFEFIVDNTELLCEIAQANLENIDLGKPFKTSEDMRKEYFDRARKKKH